MPAGGGSLRVRRLASSRSDASAGTHPSEMNSPRTWTEALVRRQADRRSETMDDSAIECDAASGVPRCGWGGSGSSAAAPASPNPPQSTRAMPPRLRAAAWASRVGACGAARAMSLTVACGVACGTVASAARPPGFHAAACARGGGALADDRRSPPPPPPLLPTAPLLPTCECRMEGRLSWSSACAISVRRSCGMAGLSSSRSTRSRQPRRCGSCFLRGRTAVGNEEG